MAQSAHRMSISNLILILMPAPTSTSAMEVALPTNSVRMTGDMIQSKNGVNIHLMLTVVTAHVLTQGIAIQQQKEPPLKTVVIS